MEFLLQLIDLGLEVSNLRDGANPVIVALFRYCISALEASDQHLILRLQPLYQFCCEGGGTSTVIDSLAHNWHISRAMTSVESQHKQKRPRGSSFSSTVNDTS